MKSNLIELITRVIMVISGILLMMQMIKYVLN